MNNLDHHDHKVARSRLYGRLLQVNGPGQLSTLYPFLISRLESSFEVEICRGQPVGSMSIPRILIDQLSNQQDGISIPIASTVRRLASKTMSLIFFGEKICKLQCCDSNNTILTRGSGEARYL